MRRKKRSVPPPATAPAASPSLSAHLPETGKVVSVGLEDVSLSWRTRVEHVEGASVTLVAPTRTLGDAIVPDVGRPVILGWAAPDGYFEAECSFAAAGVDTVVTWIVEVRRVARLQRRSAFRIDTNGTVTLRIRGTAHEARLRNVSEGGLCCELPERLAPDEGEGIEVVAELEELGTFESPARVVRASPSSEVGRIEIGLAFTGMDEGKAEELRQFVFAEQLRRRRALSGR